MNIENTFNEVCYLTELDKAQWKNYIGKGYRSVCYSTNSDREGQITLFGFDLEGNPKTFICPHRSWIKYVVRYETDELDIYDRYIKTQYFRNSYERKKYIEDSSGLTIVECLRPESEFLHMLFDYDVREESFNQQPLREQFIDIETEISESFMKPSQAANRINMITIFDSLTAKYYTWSLAHAEIDFKEEPLCNYPKTMFEFFEFGDDEPSMLEHFIAWIQANYPDVSISWNGQSYDWPYIIRRIENVLGKRSAAKISPVGKYRIKDVNHENSRANGEAEIEVDIQGLFIADDLILYRDKFIVRGALDGGYSLNNVGEAESLGTKIQYDGTLKDLYVKDYQKFYEYNVRDVDLLCQIEKKCGLIPLARQIAGSGLVNYNAIYSSISYLIGSIGAYSKAKRNKVFVSYVAEKNQQVTFEGAYVFPTLPGVYKGGVAVIDFNSLYPSIIMALNASPETYKGKLRIFRKKVTGEVYEDMAPFNYDTPGDISKLTLELSSKKSTEITIEQLRSILDHTCIFSPNNTLFLKHEVKVGVITAWCKEVYGLRKETKGKELAIFHKLHSEEFLKGKSPEELKQLTTQMANYHTAQVGFKAQINSAYGMYGTAFSPIFNPNIAQSITRLGQMTNRGCSEFIGKTFKERYGTDDSYQLAVGGDTDSFIGSTKVSVIFSDETRARVGGY